MPADALEVGGAEILREHDDPRRDLDVRQAQIPQEPEERAGQPALDHRGVRLVRQRPAHRRAVGQVDRRRREVGLDEGEPAAGSRDPAHLAHRGLPAVEIDEQPLGADAVEARRRPGQGGGIADPEVDAETGRRGPPRRVGDEVGALVEPGDGPRPGERGQAQGLEAKAAADVEDAAPPADAAAVTRQDLELLQLRDAVEGLQRRDIARDMPGAVHVDELLEREVIHHAAPHRSDGLPAHRPRLCRQQDRPVRAAGKAALEPCPQTLAGLGAPGSRNTRARDLRRA